MNIISSLLLLLLLILQNYFCIFQTLVEGKRGASVHIVYLGAKKFNDPVATQKSHLEMLSTLLGSKEAARRSILYSYRHGFSGFAAKLTKTEAKTIAEFTEVVQVIPNRIHKLHTTRSWDFIGMHHHSPNNLFTENMGKGIIIGVIDSGIWPESESFKDEGIDNIPSHWRGICQQGDQFNSSNCNKKLIGARWFIKGFKEQISPINTTTKSGDFLSPRDGIGHGTHTASIAAGYFVEKANYKGLAKGLARGGAPLAHLAIYKACWNIETGGCADADLLKAFDKAIYDGVDILSVSIGFQIPLFSYVDQRDTIAIGSFHAVSKGITVVSSAGNDGPLSQTIANTAPWLITVAATKIDRAFPTAITLGNNHTVWGQSVDVGSYDHKFVPLTYSERIAVDSQDDSAKDCELGSLNATLAKGHIVLCFSESDQQNIVSASRAVREAGGVGLVFAQFPRDGMDSCNDIPCIKVDYEVGTQILSYIRKARSPTAKLSSPKTVIGRWMSPKVASFSSRGPSSMTPSVLKPDVAAPGVDILASFRPVSKANSNSYVLLSGTSMACPHVAGIAALVKSAHTNWSPAAIRSALVTTAASQTGTNGIDIPEEGSTRKAADPFDMGGGHVNPNKALDPGLIFDICTEEYIQFLCTLGYNSLSITSLVHTKINCTEESHLDLDLNLPSITIPNLKTPGTVTVTRTVTNVGDISSVYKASWQAPQGIEMTVEPLILTFNSTTRNQSFRVLFSSSQKVHGDYEFGSLTWTDGKHLVRSPIAIRVITFESYSDV